MILILLNLFKYSVFYGSHFIFYFYLLIMISIKLFVFGIFKRNHNFLINSTLLEIALKLFLIIINVPKHIRHLYICVYFLIALQIYVNVLITFWRSYFPLIFLFSICFYLSTRHYKFQRARFEWYMRHMRSVCGQTLSMLQATHMWHSWNILVDSMNILFFITPYRQLIQ